jgi:hypothetical protein
MQSGSEAVRGEKGVDRLEENETGRGRQAESAR